MKYKVGDLIQIVRTYGLNYVLNKSFVADHFIKKIGVVISVVELPPFQEKSRFLYTVNVNGRTVALYENDIKHVSSAKKEKKDE